MTTRRVGSVFGVLTRLTKLDDVGAPLVGAANMFYSNKLVQIDFGLEYTEGATVEQRNAAGDMCVFYQAPDSLRRLTISNFQFCIPDPEAEEFLAGGTIIAGTPATNTIGYQAPAIGSAGQPNGVGVEVWSNAILDGQKAGYIRWLFPLTRLKFSGTRSISAETPVLPTFEGFGYQNANWGDGPVGDWTYSGSAMVYQWVEEAALPAGWAYGTAAVVADGP